MELNDNAKKNVIFEVIRTMTEREIAYKDSIDKKIKGIKVRQILGIIISGVIFIMLISILFIVIKNIDSINQLIKVLISSFNELNK